MDHFHDNGSFSLQAARITEIAMTDLGRDQMGTGEADK